MGRAAQPHGRHMHALCADAGQVDARERGARGCRANLRPAAPARDDAGRQPAGAPHGHRARHRWPSMGRRHRVAVRCAAPPDDVCRGHDSEEVRCGGGAQLRQRGPARAAARAEERLPAQPLPQRHARRRRRVHGARPPRARGPQQAAALQPAACR
eukprot:1107299-Prymnesium_polylepis.1